MKKETKVYPGFEISYIKTDKFRSIDMSLNIGKKMVKEEKIFMYFLYKMLFENSKKYPNRVAVGQKAEENYMQYVGNNYSMNGDNMFLNFETKFLNEKYVEKNHNKNCLDFFFEKIFNPNVADNKFDEETFNIVKKQIKIHLETLKENPMQYANIKALTAAGYETKYNEKMLDDLEKVNPSNLYDFYKDIIENGYFEVYIVGEIDDNFLKIIEEKIDRNENGKTYDFIKYLPVEEKRLSEKTNNSQTNVIIIYKLSNLTKEEYCVTMAIYNAILGEGPSSKLFTNVREKNSLCYTVHSSLKSSVGRLKINTGINLNNLNKALELINEQLSEIEKGNVTEKELNAAKASYYESIETEDDDSYRMLKSMFGEKHLQFLTNEKLTKIIDSTTIEDVKKVAAKIKLDTIYILEGVAND